MDSNILKDPLIAFPDRAPRRIVSLVPSMTASLFDLGVGGALVGVSDYCTDPQEGVAALPKVGGPKTPDTAGILALQPDLVIANQEENSRGAVEMLSQAGIPVWLTFPTTVKAAVDDLWTVASLFRSDLAMDRVRFLEQSVEWAELSAAEMPPLRYFCPIWEGCLDDGERWWMTFNVQTYPHDVLRLFNGVNVFADRERRYPLQADLGHGQAETPAGRDTRYPRLSLEEIVLAKPELILLPNEPYAYTAASASDIIQTFASTPAAKSGRVFTLDGTLITWHGTRLARALNELPALFSLPGH